MFRIRSAAVADNLHLQVVVGNPLAETVVEVVQVVDAEHPNGQPSMR